jgi:hypothetical protein
LSVTNWPFGIESLTRSLLATALRGCALPCART